MAAAQRHARRPAVEAIHGRLGVRSGQLAPGKTAVDMASGTRDARMSTHDDADGSGRPRTLGCTLTPSKGASARTDMKRLQATSSARRVARGLVARVVPPVRQTGLRLIAGVRRGPSDSLWLPLHRAYKTYRQLRPLDTVDVIPIARLMGVPVEQVPVLSGALPDGWELDPRGNPFLDSRQPLRLTVHAAGLKRRAYLVRTLLQELHASAHVRVVVVGDLWPGEPELARPLPSFRLSREAVSLHPQRAGKDLPLAILGEGWRARLLALPHWDMFRIKAARPTPGAPSRDDSTITRRLEGYAALLAHAKIGGHLFVTEDEDLLTEQDEPLWHGIYMCSRLEALAIAGALARLRNWLEYEFDDDGMPEEISHAAEAYRWMTDPFNHGLERVAYQEADGTAIDEAVSAMRERLLWLTMARDQVVVGAVPHGYNEASLPAILALSTLAVAAKALMDNFCAAAIGLLGLQRVTMTKDGWIVELKRCRSNWNAMSRSLQHTPRPHRWAHTRLLQASDDSRLTATMKVIEELRNAVAHAEPLQFSHHGYVLGGPSELRVTLSRAQASALQNLVKERGEERSDWGLTDGNTVRYPWRFADRFYRASIEAWLDLVAALLEACRVEKPQDKNPRVEDDEETSPDDGRILIRSYAPVFQFVPDSNRAILAGFYDWPIYRDLCAQCGRTIVG
jgi:hypothetical protein